jgi:hypothetical protein
VRVAADVIHHLLGSGERRFGVDDPFHIAHGIEKPEENLTDLEGPRGKRRT